ncbi:MAG: lipid IV(A) 3-deoxy-D-manno-octulosonic acid transferase [Gammaproteobacteria bacterium]
MRRLYTLLFYLALPAVLARMLWRSRKAPDYRRRWAERFGWFTALPQPGCIWVHAVSVGETRAALPLIQALRESHRTIPILVTTTTPTGSHQVRASLGQAVYHVYLPYDLPAAIRRFLHRTRPCLAVIMETELWPNLLHGCAAAGIPLVIANARLGERSTRRYAWAAVLTRDMLGCVTLIAAQTQADATRFRALGVAPERLQVIGNIKYDLSLPEGLEEQGRLLRRSLFGPRPVLIAASTHAGEDEQVLNACAILRKRWPSLLLILVPRHPERFDAVADLCKQRGWRVVKRSEQRPCTPNTDAFLGDSMGELLLFYAAADVAFVGGSLVPTGGHNILEPALLAMPVIFGPHMFNFAEASQHLLTARAAWQVADAQELARVAGQLLDDPTLRRAAGQRGKAAVEANRGALEKLFEAIQTILETTAVPRLPSPQPPLRGVKRL